MGSTQRTLLRCLADREARTVRTAATHAGLTYGQARNTMSTLHRRGYVVATKPRWWTITDEGEVALEILRAHEFLEVQRRRRR